MRSVPRRLRLYAGCIGGAVLLGYLAMGAVANGACARRWDRTCGPGEPEPRRTELMWAGIILGAGVGLVAALAMDDALWKRRR